MCNQVSPQEENELSLFCLYLNYIDLYILYIVDI